MSNKCYNKALHDSEIIGALWGKKNTVLDLVSKLTELKDSVPSGKKNKYASAIECINEIMEVGLE